MHHPGLILCCLPSIKRDGDDFGRGHFLVMIEMPRGKEAGASAQVSSQAGAWEQAPSSITVRTLSEYRLHVNVNIFRRIKWGNNRSAASILTGFSPCREEVIKSPLDAWS
jgi:hypothetical protein